MKIVLKKRRVFFQKILGLIIFLGVITILGMSFLAILTHFKPVFQEKAVILARLRATEIINSAVVDVFSGIESCDFVNISKNNNDEISLISANSVEMNRLKATVSKTVSEKAKSEDDYYVHIPLGSLTKYPVLQGMGYRIPIKVSLDGITKTDFKEEFMSAGINQVKSRIYIIVSARISIVSSIMTVSEVVSTEIPVLDTIIVGNVPNYYGDSLSVVGR